MKTIMMLLCVVIWMLGGAAVGQASPVVCPFDGLNGMWSRSIDDIDGKRYDVYRCARGHEFLDMSWHNGYGNNGDCPFDGTFGNMTGAVEIVDGRRYNVYRCMRGHEYLYVPQTVQPAVPDPSYQAGLAIGSVLGDMLGAKFRSVQSDHDDTVNEKYDFSAVKTVFIVVDTTVSAYDVSDMSAYTMSGYWLQSVLEEKLGAGRLQMIVDDPAFEAWLAEEYVKYAEAGGTMLQDEFGRHLIEEYSDLIVMIKADMIGRDHDRARCNMVISAFDPKKQALAFVRKEERVHMNRSSKIYTEQDVVYKTVHDYAEKLAKLIKRADK